MALACGARVRLRGLAARLELNGQEGECTEWKHDTGRWVVRLCSGATLALKEASLEALPPPRLRLVLSSASMQGKRQTNEDRHVKIPDLTKAARALKMPIDHLEQPCAFLAVYDGHCGQLCSDFVAKGFHVKLLRRLSAEPDRAVWTDDRLEGALRSVCEELDTEFLARFRTAQDGTTLVVALVVGERCFIAWAGDSRAVLCRRDPSDGSRLASAVTKDHRPSNEAEAQRVRALGGEVVELGDGAMRVAQGGYEERVRELIRAEQQGLGLIGKQPVAMAVSRSIGDRDFKTVTRGADIISATPEVTTLRLGDADRFLVLISDGITDVLRDEELVATLAAAGADADEGDGAGDAQAACSRLVQESLRRGSMDNVTAALVRFEWEPLATAPKRIVAPSGPPLKRARLDLTCASAEDGY